MNSNLQDIVSRRGRGVFPLRLLTRVSNWKFEYPRRDPSRVGSRCHETSQKRAMNIPEDNLLSFSTRATQIVVIA